MISKLMDFVIVVFYLLMLKVCRFLESQDTSFSIFKKIKNDSKPSKLVSQ